MMTESEFQDLLRQIDETVRVKWKMGPDGDWANEDDDEEDDL